MKKSFILTLLLVVAVAFCPSAFAVGTTHYSGDIAFRSTILANGRAGGALNLASSSTTLTTADLAYSVVQKKVGGGGGLDSSPGSTLPNGTPGQVITFIITGLQSGGTWLLTPTTKTGFRSITFDTKGDLATLLYVDDTIGWIIQSANGVTISQA